MAGTILTTIGLSKLAAATPQNQLNITHIAVGDGNGGFPTLSPNSTALTNEVWRGDASNPIKDGSNSTYVYFETNIPPESGPFDVREIACFDIEGNMIAIGHTSLIQKPNPVDDASFAVAVKIFIALENASDFDLIYQNTEVTSHNSLIGRNSAGAHDDIYTRNFKSAEDMVSKIDSSGNVVEFTALKEYTKIYWQGRFEQSDGGSNWGVLRFGDHTADGGSIFSVDANTYIQANLKGKSINIRKFGARGIVDKDGNIDESIDDSDSIQAALYYAYGGKPSKTQISPFIKDVTVVIPEGYFRITKQILHPPYVNVVGRSTGSINGYGLAGINGRVAKGSIIFADLEDPNQTAWLASGYKVSEGGGNNTPIGEIVDVYKDSISGTAYDGGHITRCYGASIKGVTFYTENYVALAVGFGGAVNGEIDICAFGFLTTVSMHSSWGTSVKVKGTGYHCGILNYNSNAVKYEGYINFNRAEGAPILDETNAPSGWYAESGIHNPASIRFLPTGLYMSFANGGSTTNLTTEKWGRGRFYNSCRGIVESSPTMEGIYDLPFHMISSFVNVLNPLIFSVPTGMVRVSSGGLFEIDNTRDNRLDYGSQQSSGASARLKGRYVSPLLISSEERFSTAVDFEFADERTLAVYVSSTGVDTNVGLNELNSVMSLEVAIERAKHFGIKKVVIADGYTAVMGTNTVIDANIDFVGGTGSSIEVEGDRILTLKNSKVTFVDLGLQVPIGTSQALRCAMVTLGSCFVDFERCAISGSSSTSIIQGVATYNSIVQLNLSSTTVSDMTFLGRNSTTDIGSITVIYTKSADSVTSTDSFESNFKVL